MMSADDGEGISEDALLDVSYYYQSKSNLEWGCCKTWTGLDWTGIFKSTISQMIINKNN